MHKLLSRKFLVALGAILQTLTGSDLTPAQLITLAIVSSVYVLAQALADRGAANREFVETVTTRVVEALKQLERTSGAPGARSPLAAIAQDLRDGTFKGATPGGGQ